MSLLKRNVFVPKSYDINIAHLLQMKNINLFMFFLFRNFLILLKNPIDLEILFFMYVIWSDQFILLSINTPKNLVLLTLTRLFPLEPSVYSKCCCLI